MRHLSGGPARSQSCCSTNPSPSLRCVCACRPARLAEGRRKLDILAVLLHGRAVGCCRHQRAVLVSGQAAQPNSGRRSYLVCVLCACSVLSVSLCAICCSRSRAHGRRRMLSAAVCLLACCLLPAGHWQMRCAQWMRQRQCTPSWVSEIRLRWGSSSSE